MEGILPELDGYPTPDELAREAQAELLAQQAADRRARIKEFFHLPSKQK